jgi:hypothetical protein
VLDSVEQAGEVPSCVSCCYGDHIYIPSDSLRICV